MRTVLLADDHPPTRAGVRSALEAAGFDVCADVPDAATALTGGARAAAGRCAAGRPHARQRDLGRPRDLAQLPDTAIVMLTISRNDDDLFDALRAGASGYLLKDMDPARLGAALDGVLAGEAALPAP